VAMQARLREPERSGCGRSEHGGARSRGGDRRRELLGDEKEEPGLALELLDAQRDATVRAGAERRDDGVRVLVGDDHRYVARERGHSGSVELSACELTAS